MAAIAPMKNTVGTPKVWTATHLTVKMGYEMGWFPLLLAIDVLLRLRQVDLKFNDRLLTTIIKK